MLKLFAQKEKISLGLDIGTHSVKAVKLRFTKEGEVCLCGFDIEPIELDLAVVIKRICQAENVNKVNIALSGQSAVARYISLPRMQLQELKQALKFEAQKHIPFPVTEVNLDTCIIKEGLPDNKMLVLLAAVKKDFLSQRMKIMESAGIKANLVDIDSLALINAFNFNYPQTQQPANLAIALLNIGFQAANLNILDSGIPRLSRDIAIAGNSFTRKIMEIFNIDFKTAEGLKIKPDEERATKVILAQEAVLANLAVELRVSFDYFESQATASVKKIYLSGGTTLMPGIKDMLASMLDIEVDYWDPFVRVKIDEKIDAQKLKANRGNLAITVGLALRK